MTERTETAIKAALAHADAVDKLGRSLAATHFLFGISTFEPYRSDERIQTTLANMMSRTAPALDFNRYKTEIAPLWEDVPATPDAEALVDSFLSEGSTIMAIAPVTEIEDSPHYTRRKRSEAGGMYEFARPLESYDVIYAGRLLDYSAMPDTAAAHLFDIAPVVVFECQDAEVFDEPSPGCFHAFTEDSLRHMLEHGLGLKCEVTKTHEKTLVAVARLPENPREQE